MRQIYSILSITGSDGTGASGIQADIRTISAMGGHALTALTSVTVQDSHGIVSLCDLDAQLVIGQVAALMADFHPRAVKVGMVRQPELVQALRDEVVGCRHIVCAPGVLDSHGHRLMSDEVIREFVRVMLPETEMLVMRCNEAEIVTGQPITGEASMLEAARWLLGCGVRGVLLRGGHCSEGLLTALLLTADDAEQPRFFTSPNTEGWQLHGVGGTLSSAIATRLAMGDTIAEAVTQAHQYIRSRVVYSARSASHGIRQVELYNRLMEEVAQWHRQQHDVTFYAERLHLTPRYLTEITTRVAGRSTKQLIADYLMQEIEQALLTTQATMQEVAEMFGFTSQAALAKFFRGQKGCSMKEFREK